MVAKQASIRLFGHCAGGVTHTQRTHRGSLPEFLAAFVRTCAPAITHIVDTAKLIVHWQIDLSRERLVVVV